MTFIRFSFHSIVADMDSIRLFLTKITLPILWNNKGRYGLIPFARIQNAFENWKDLHTGSDEGSIGKFDWRDVIPVPLPIANALLGEDKDDKCTYRGKGSPKSS